LLEASQLDHAHTGELPLPAVKGLPGDADLAVDLGYSGAALDLVVS